MCGITGFFASRGDIVNQAGVVRTMTDTLHHRGPDDSDVWLDREAGTAFGHRRLSIIDLSPLGRQPMAAPSGRYVICYNGEVYNFKELRRELEDLGHGFRGGSDTEVLLAGFEQWGVHKAVERFVGMFAFALWDRKESSLHLVRDRLGIKPLYYGWAGRSFIFGSELKALKAFPHFDSTVDRNSLALFFRHNYIPAPHTIYTNARKLEPGKILTVQGPEFQPDIRTYWSAADVWNSGFENGFSGGEADAVDELERLLKESVRLRMVADVPVGAFLSGGIDSSLVVALMQAQSSRPVKTFSIGFEERGYNEAEHAKAVAGHLGTEHTELYLTSKDLLDVVPLIPKFWDEPFSDSSQIPTYCVSHLAKRDVTVALTGDGGDELFAGYERYFWMDRWKMVERIPLALRKAMAPVVKAVPDMIYGLFGAVGYKIGWRLDMLGMRDFDEFYHYFMSHNQHPAWLVPGAHEPVTPMTADYGLEFDDRFRKMTFRDTVAYLPDDILVKADRASMAVSLELRIPILDHRVVEFAATLPVSMKVEKTVGKKILRRLLYRHVPQDLVDRPKMGFGVPVREWLEHDLREWCMDMLNSGRIRRQGYLDAAAVTRMLERFMNGQTMWCPQIWNILMFQAWAEENGL